MRGIASLAVFAMLATVVVSLNAEEAPVAEGKPHEVPQASHPAKASVPHVITKTKYVKATPNDYPSLHKTATGSFSRRRTSLVPKDHLAKKFDSMFSKYFKDPASDLEPGIKVVANEATPGFHGESVAARTSPPVKKTVEVIRELVPEEDAPEPDAKHPPQVAVLNGKDYSVKKVIRVQQEVESQTPAPKLNIAAEEEAAATKKLAAERKRELAVEAKANAAPALTVKGQLVVKPPATKKMLKPPTKPLVVKKPEVVKAPSVKPHKVLEKPPARQVDTPHPAPRTVVAAPPTPGHVVLPPIHIGYEPVLAPGETPHNEAPLKPPSSPAEPKEDPSKMKVPPTPAKPPKEESKHTANVPLPEDQVFGAPPEEKSGNAAVYKQSAPWAQNQNAPFGGGEEVVEPLVEIETSDDLEHVDDAPWEETGKQQVAQKTAPASEKTVPAKEVSEQIDLVQQAAKDCATQKVAQRRACESRKAAAEKLCDSPTPECDNKTKEAEEYCKNSAEATKHSCFKQWMLAKHGAA